MGRPRDGVSYDSKMLLEGSCQCGKVAFSVDSETPYPFMFCYCSICRKTSGAVTSNVMGRRATLKVKGARYMKCHHAVIRKKGRPDVRSEGERWFCAACGSHLYVLDDRWPEGVWPNAAAIDTPLPVPSEHVQMMMRYRPEWVPTVDDGPRFPEYPKLSIAAWHEQHGWTRTAAPAKSAARARSVASKKKAGKARSKRRA